MSGRARRAVVAGAGIAGLAAAIQLQRRGWAVEIHEAATAPGGLVRPFHFRGVRCDLGSHRLHPSALTDPLLAEIGPAVEMRVRPRRGRIVFGGRHIPYPMSLTGLLRGLGARRAARFCRDALRLRSGLGTWERDRTAVRDGSDVGFEAFVTARVGRAAYEAFYRPYAEKVWGIPAAALSQSVAKKRVSTASPLRHVTSMLAQRARARTFLYPGRGMGAVIDALVQRCRSSGVAIQCDRPLVDPDRVDADAVVYSGDLARLAADTHGLSHRGLYLVFLALPTARLSAVDTWYAPERRFWFGRVSEVQNFTDRARRPGETVVCVEIPEGAWGPTQDFTARLPELLEQLAESGISGRDALRPLEARQVFLPKVYPMYRRGWLAPWRRLMAQVTSTGRVLPIGRQGLFLHCNIDHCTTIAREAAEHLDRGGSTSAWAQRAEDFLDLRVRD